MIGLIGIFENPFSRQNTILLIYYYCNKFWCKKISMSSRIRTQAPSGHKQATCPRHFSILYKIFSSIKKAETSHRLNLGNIPAIAGKTRLGQFPAIAGKSLRYSRELRWAKISFLQLVTFPAIALKVIRPANAFITVNVPQFHGGVNHLKPVKTTALTQSLGTLVPIWPTAVYQKQATGREHEGKNTVQ